MGSHQHSGVSEVSWENTEDDRTAVMEDYRMCQLKLLFQIYTLHFCRWFFLRWWVTTFLKCWQLTQQEKKT